MSNKRSKSGERMQTQAKPTNRVKERSIPKTINIKVKDNNKD